MGLIESLENPALYAPVPAQVRVMETHLSWIILAEPYAYKIKKPVNLGFADFTTLDRRRYFCHEEVRLNQPLAPQLYLAVVPITGSTDVPVVAGSGRPIEYAVKMRQFPQSNLFRQMIREGRLLARHVDQLAKTIAHFHRNTATSDPQDRFGTAQSIGEPVEANFREFAELVRDDEQQVSVRAAEAWSRSEFAARQADFSARKQAGFVRECHGDMHLGNIVLLDEEPVLFDRIEFNEPFRWIDVINDLAFPVMDMERRGRSDLAYRLLNHYLEVTGDYAGLCVLHYYVVYRALVRAKVAGIRARQERNSPQERERLWNRLPGYMDLVARHTRPEQPVLMITHGVAGSGKTIGTQALLEKRLAIRIRSDIERKRLFGLDAQSRSHSGVGQQLYSAEVNHQTYCRLAELATTVLQTGFPVIVDAAFLRRSDRDMFHRLADRLGVPFLLLDFRASTETLRRRVAHRRGDASEAGVAVLNHQLATQQPLEQDEESTVIAVDCETSHETEALLAEIESRTRSLVTPEVQL
ncbi:MAG: bifunctional aminoglycoside phosphotransferase/ATP-binding protein [Pirellulaceae bacterium]